MTIKLSILTLLTLIITACSSDMPEQPTLPSEQTQNIQNNDVQNSILKEIATSNNIDQNDGLQNESTQNNDVIIGGTYHSLNYDENYPDLVCINYDKAIKEVTLVGFDEDDMNYTSKFLTLPVMQDRQLLEKCNAEASLTESRYIAYLPKYSKLSGYGQAFDAIDANGIITKGQIVGLDFDKDGQQDFLTTCSSMEGEHFNAWQDKTRSLKLAYAYRHIDAHLIATCEEIDYDNSYL